MAWSHENVTDVMSRPENWAAIQLNSFNQILMLVVKYPSEWLMKRIRRNVLECLCVVVCLGLAGQSQEDPNTGHRDASLTGAIIMSS
jgi:hypothetical protein